MSGNRIGSQQVVLNSLCINIILNGNSWGCLLQQKLGITNIFLLPENNPLPSLQAILINFNKVEYSHFPLTLVYPFQKKHIFIQDPLLILITSLFKALYEHGSLFNFDFQHHTFELLTFPYYKLAPQYGQFVN